METGQKFHRTNKLAKFKSYYVVWKPGKKEILLIFCDSLNRTMQYGNIITKNGIQKSETGLNRTMQYGNFVSLSE